MELPWQKKEWHFRWIQNSLMQSLRYLYSFMMLFTIQSHLPMKRIALHYTRILKQISSRAYMLIPVLNQILSWNFVHDMWRTLSSLRNHTLPQPKSIRRRQQRIHRIDRNSSYSPRISLYFSTRTWPYWGNSLKRISIMQHLFGENISLCLNMYIVPSELRFWNHLHQVWVVEE